MVLVVVFVSVLEFWSCLQYGLLAIIMRLNELPLLGLIDLVHPELTGIISKS